MKLRLSTLSFSTYHSPLAFFQLLSMNNIYTTAEEDWQMRQTLVTILKKIGLDKTDPSNFMKKRQTLVNI